MGFLLVSFYSPVMLHQMEIIICINNNLSLLSTTNEFVALTTYIAQYSKTLTTIA